MSLSIYNPTHPVGCMCDPCNRMAPKPMPQMMPNTYQEPMRSLTVGTAPVHLVCDGVIVETSTDKYGREICSYKLDPLFADTLTAQKVCDAFEAMDAAALLKIMTLLVSSLPVALEATPLACTALASGLISADAANTIRAGSDGKLFENDAVI